jgi:hypothetical protein
MLEKLFIANLAIDQIGYVIILKNKHLIFYIVHLMTDVKLVVTLKVFYHYQLIEYATELIMNTLYFEFIFFMLIVIGVDAMPVQIFAYI